MQFSWLTSVFPIALLFTFRMLGLFMLIPVFSVLANQLDHATPTLIGVALGSYGLSQGLLQIPFGLLSDKFGRKLLIAAGLVLFMMGSIFGALTHSIYGMIVARVMQGMGAIGSVLIALLADLTHEKDRAKGMAVIGMTIGLSFSLAVIISPAITERFGLAGIFYLTAFLASLGLLLLYFVIPNPLHECFHQDSETNLAMLTKVLVNKQLQTLNAGIFIQHFILTATFFAVPMVLRTQISAGHLIHSWYFYLPLMLVSFITMVPLIVVAEKRQRVKQIFLACVALTGLSQAFLGFFSNQWPLFCLLMFMYFVGFNFLEANLPALISKQANPTSKGTAMGVYSSCQYLGIFIGGCWAGVAFQMGGIQTIFLTNVVIAIIWFLISRNNFFRAI